MDMNERQLRDSESDRTAGSNARLSFGAEDYNTTSYLTAKVGPPIIVGLITGISEVMGAHLPELVMLLLPALVVVALNTTAIQRAEISSKVLNLLRNVKQMEA